MMNIEQKRNDDELTIYLEGRLDTNSSRELEQTLKQSMDGVQSLVFDLEKLEYVSSAGLRIFLSAHKLLHGNVTIRNVQEDVRDILEITGFVDILNIEDT